MMIHQETFGDFFPCEIEQESNKITWLFVKRKSSFGSGFMLIKDNY